MSRIRALSGAAAFRRVLDDGRRVRRDGLLVAAAPAPAGSGVRLGLTVGRRVGPATVRNAVKRRLRTAVTALGLDGDVDVVIRAEPEVSSRKFADVQADLSRALAAALPEDA